MSDTVPPSLTQESQPPVEPPVQPSAQEDPAPPDKPEIDWKSEARKWETRAKANHDAAARLAEIEESQKSEAQKQAEALTKLQQENEALKLATIRAEVAAAKGVPTDLLTGSTQEEIESAADRLIEFRGASQPKQRPDFGGGKRGDDPNSIASLDQQIADAQKAGDHRLSIALKRQRQALQVASAT